jgi:YidC/Oxa1 family membrane protein insertase
MIDLISLAFNTLLINPLTNLFVLMSRVTGSAGIGVILLTIFIRAVTLPTTLKQMHTTRMMAAINPRMQDIQKKYKDPKRRSEEQMKLYKEAGINPLGCFSGMVLQFPILISLYRVFSLAVGDTPEALIKVHGRLYNVDFLRTGLPLNSDFLWLHLGRPDPLLLPILVAGTTFILQKVTTLPAQTEQQRAQAGMMNLMMPLIFGWITINLPSGLGLYYVLSNLIGVVLQYAYIGGGPINWRAVIGLSQDPVLPRALDVRMAQMKALERSQPDDEDDEEQDDNQASRSKSKSSTPAPAGESAGARRRRRYGNGGGQRRSRR